MALLQGPNTDRPSLAWEVFTGKVQSVESGFGRKHGGRRLWIDGYGAAMSGKGRTPMQMSWGKARRQGSRLAR